MVPSPQVDAAVVNAIAAVQHRFLHDAHEAPGDFGPEQGRMYDHIAKSRPEAIGTDEVKWNFTKFLVDRDGSVIRRYESTATPEQIKSDIEPLLG